MSTISLLGFDSTAGNRIPKMPYSSRRLLMKKNPQIRNVDKKITYLNDYHPKNSEAAMIHSREQEAASFIKRSLEAARKEQQEEPPATKPNT